MTGREVDPLTEAARRELAEAESERDSASKKVAYRPVPSEFAQLWQDLRDGWAALGASGRAWDVAQRLARMDTGAIAEQSVLQRTAEQVSDRLLRRYPLYGDVATPCRGALACVRHGLALLAVGAARSAALPGVEVRTSRSAS